MIQLKCPHCAKDIRAADEQAGKRVRCPGCKDVLTVPAASTAVQASPPAATQPKPPTKKVAIADEEPIVLVPAIEESEDGEDDRPRRPRSRSRDEDEKGDHPRRRDRRRDEDDEEDDDRPRRRRSRRRRGQFADCPTCDAPGDATRVGFTWWGGALGPWLFTHVRCNECGACYNGKSGKSNETAIAIYLIVSVVAGLAIAVCGGIVAVLGHH